MLKLRTPVTVGRKTYDVLVPGKGSWDFRSRRIELQIVLAQEQPDQIRLGKEVPTTDGYTLLSPPVVLSCEIQDKDQDSAINLIIQAFRPACEAIERAILDSLLTATFELGEDVFSLAADFDQGTKDYQNERAMPLKEDL